MRMKTALAIAVIAVLAGCTRGSGAESTAEKSARTASGDTAERSATLVVRQRYRDGFYVEGSVGFVEVSRPGSETVTRLERQIEGDESVSLVLPPGSYSLTSWQRPCDGNCQDGFDPPVDGCEASVTLDPGQTAMADVTVKPDSGCQIRIRRSTD
jgi:hypothetical protein